MDRIAVNGIRALGAHGADPGERETLQAFVVDIALECDLREAASSDELAATIDYATLQANVVDIIEQRSYVLLERLAAEILASIFVDARIASARVRVGKPEKLDGATPSVTLSRANPRYRH
ncbi:MAG: dihydroneopterin aldolase [Vulcanimicrobiaceae bacterium]